MTAPAGPPPWARLVFALALGAYGAIAAWLVWRTSILEPYSDMFEWMARWYRLRADGDLGRYLWAPHNFHHLVWTFAVLGLDIEGFGGSGYFILAVGAACFAAIAAMLAAVGAAAAGRGLRLVGGGVAAALGLMGCHVLDASAVINMTYVHALVFAVAAVLLAEAPSRWPAARGAATLTCAVAASLGSSAGLAVWPALLGAGWKSRRRGWTLAVLAVGLAFGALYALGEAAPNQTGVHPPDQVHAAEAALLFVNYLGLPWARGLDGAGWVAGLAVLGMAVAAVALRGRRAAPWPERAAVALILFSLATAAMAGLARAGVVPADRVPIRYAIFLAPLHAGLWVLALPYLRSVWGRRPRTMAGATAALAAAMLLHQAAMAVYAVRTADASLRAIADFRAGRRTPSMSVTIHPDLAEAQALSQRMRRDGLYQRELRPDPGPAPQRIGYFGFMD